MILVLPLFALLVFVPIISRRKRTNNLWRLVALSSFIVVLANYRLFILRSNDRFIDSINQFYILLILVLAISIVRRIGSTLYIPAEISKLQHRMLSILLIFYVFASLFFLMSNGQRLLELFTGGVDWKISRDAVYNEETRLYSNRLEQVSLIYTSRLRIPILASSFYCLSIGRLRRIAFVCLILAVMNQFLLSAITAGRGNLIALYVEFLIVYQIVKGKFSERVKKYVTLSSLSLVILLMLYITSVSVARFGAARLVWMSVEHYMSHSFLTLNLVLNEFDSYGYGAYAFGVLGDIDSVMKPLSEIVGSRFYTWIGALFVDLGYLGTLSMLTALWTLVYIKTPSSYKTKISNMTWNIYLVKFLVMGVFVIGHSFIIDVIILTVVTGILKYFRL